jgi:hypothetical protein
MYRQRIGRADREQGRAQPLQVRIEWGDVGHPAIRDGRQERVVELLHVDRPQHEASIAEGTLAGRHTQVEGAVDQVRAAKAGVAVPVAHP